MLRARENVLPVDATPRAFSLGLSANSNAIGKAVATTAAALKPAFRDKTNNTPFVANNSSTTAKNRGHALATPLLKKALAGKSTNVISNYTNNNATAAVITTSKKKETTKKPIGLGSNSIGTSKQQSFSDVDKKTPLGSAASRRTLSSTSLQKTQRGSSSLSSSSAKIHSKTSLHERLSTSVKNRTSEVAAKADAELSLLAEDDDEEIEYMPLNIPPPLPLIKEMNFDVLTRPSNDIFVDPAVVRRLKNAEPRIEPIEDIPPYELEFTLDDLPSI